MKKLIACLIMAGFVLSLSVGCGGSGTVKDKSKTETTTKETKETTK